MNVRNKIIYLSVILYLMLLLCHLLVHNLHLMPIAQKFCFLMMGGRADEFLHRGVWSVQGKSITIFAEIFVIVLILDVTFITKFKKLNNWRCQSAACWAP